MVLRRDAVVVSCKCLFVNKSRVGGPKIICVREGCCNYDNSMAKKNAEEVLLLSIVLFIDKGFLPPF